MKDCCYSLSRPGKGEETNFFNKLTKTKVAKQESNIQSPHTQARPGATLWTKPALESLGSHLLLRHTLKTQQIFLGIKQMIRE